MPNLSAPWVSFAPPLSISLCVFWASPLYTLHISFSSSFLPDLDNKKPHITFHIAVQPGKRPEPPRIGISATWELSLGKITTKVAIQSGVGPVQRQGCHRESSLHCLGHWPLPFLLVALHKSWQCVCPTKCTFSSPALHTVKGETGLDLPPKFSPGTFIVFIYTWMLLGWLGSDKWIAE